MTYILSHDLGTTGNKATLFSENGSVFASQFCPYPTVYPQPGQAEQNAEDYWKAFCKATRDLIAASEIKPSEIAVVSFSAQMMAALPVGKDGRPLRPAIIWSDMRSSLQTSRIAEVVGEEEVYRITGHRLSPSYSAAKIMWIRDHEPDIYRKTSQFLQVKDYVIYRLTGNAVTDYSDATGTNLFDVTSMRWSDEMLNAAGIEAEKLPEPVLGTALVGGIAKDASEESGLQEGTPVVAGGGDGACATYGSGVLDDSEAYLCLGTSSWMATSVEGPVIDRQMRIGNYALFEKGRFMPTGSMNSGGGALKWFIDSVLEGEDRIDYDDLIGRAEAVTPGVRGLLFLPYLMGERSPLWDHNARGTFIGLSMAHGRNEMVRAVLEGVAYHIRSILEVFQQNRIDPAHVRIIGGGANSLVWSSIIGDILGKQIVRLNVVDEATSVGAAMAGGVGVGLFSSFREAGSFVEKTGEIEPDASHAAVYQHTYQAFRQAYQSLTGIFRLLGDSDGPD